MLQRGSNERICQVKHRGCHRSCPWIPARSLLPHAWSALEVSAQTYELPVFVLGLFIAILPGATRNPARLPDGGANHQRATKQKPPQWGFGQPESLRVLLFESFSNWLCAAACFIELGHASTFWKQLWNMSGFRVGSQRVASEVPIVPTEGSPWWIGPTVDSTLHCIPMTFLYAAQSSFLIFRTFCLVPEIRGVLPTWHFDSWMMVGTRYLSLKLYVLFMLSIPCQCFQHSPFTIVWFEAFSCAKYSHLISHSLAYRKKIYTVYIYIIYI